MAEGKIGYLDGLRGVAALIVVFCHYSLNFCPAFMLPAVAIYSTGIENLVGRTPLNIIYNGRFAVYIFFVLSGYVLTQKFFSSHDYNVLKSGAIRRYLRLLPPILLSLLCFAFVVSVLHPDGNTIRDLTGSYIIQQVFDRQVDAWQLLYQGFYQDFFDGSNVFHQFELYNGVLWTMGVEFIGSMIVFSFAALFGENKNRWVFYIASLAVFINTYYTAFIIGMLFADVIGNGIRIPLARFNTGWRNVGLTLFLLAVGVFIGTCAPAADGGTFSHSLAAGMVLAAVFNSSLLKRILSGKAFLFLGAISFSMYLMHYVVLGAITTPLFIYLYDTAHLTYLVTSVIALIVTVAVVFLVSYVAYRLVDEPGTRLSKKAYVLFFSPAAKAPAGKESRSFYDRIVSLLKI